MKKLIISIAAIALILFCSCQTKTVKEEVKVSIINQETINLVINQISDANSDVNKDLLQRGVASAAKLWYAEDGTVEEFVEFCISNYQVTEADKLELFRVIQDNFEALNGRYNQISVDWKRRLHEPMGDILSIDGAFGAFDPFAHFSDDMFKSKIAFVVLLNFPTYTLEEKNSLGVNWSRDEWAFARLGDYFGSRVPAALTQNLSEKLTVADTYISNYNIMMGNLRNDNGEQLFPDNMALITHWGLRDELKSNYANADGRGLEKQRMIYKVMTHIVEQTIPADVIANDKYTWNPNTNEVKDLKGDVVVCEREADVRYQMLYNLVQAHKAFDPYTPAYPTYLNRAFNQLMEMTDKEIEEMFVAYIQSPEIEQMAELISKRVGRDLEPFDIWYNGFKANGAISEDQLSEQTRKLYPNPAAFEAALPGFMQKLGFTEEKALNVCSKIEVDPSRGAGHAWGAMAKFDHSHLRSRIAADGMDYKGYNIGTHEFGHNVEQTISMYDVDNYFMAGVPSTAFTEALAFIFQTRDMYLLGYDDTDPNAEAMKILDIAWGAYEIMGVSLVDLYNWRWLYDNPNADVFEFKAAILNNAVEVWNKYYAPILGHKDSNILAVYSHMIDNPLYLPNYPYGHLVEAQLEEFLQGKNLGDEVCRIYPAGRLTPNVWMQNAVGAKVSIDPLLRQTREAIEAVGTED